MTKLEALKKSRAMWLWLYENPGESKMDYLYDVPRLIDPSNVLNGCYICQYHITDQAVVCTGNCPINWGSNKPYACESNSSPYYDWQDTSSGSVEEHDAAGKIIDLHDAAIKEYEG